MQFEEFADCLAWWKKRKEGPQAWKVKAAEIVMRGYSLDLKNPNAKQGLEHVPPAELVARMRGNEAEVQKLLGEIEALVNEVRA
jgi:type I restriction enzyme M protein